MRQKWNPQKFEHTQSKRKVYRQTEIHRQSQKQVVDAKGHKLPPSHRFPAVLVDFVAVGVVCSSELKANSANTLSRTECSNSIFSLKILFICDMFSYVHCTV